MSFRDGGKRFFWILSTSAVKLRPLGREDVNQLVSN